MISLRREEISLVKEQIDILENQLSLLEDEDADPDPLIVSRAANILWGIAKIVTTYCGKMADTAIQSGVNKVGAAIGTAVGTGVAIEVTMPGTIQAVAEAASAFAKVLGN